MPQRILSSVLLPHPLRPMIPRVSPRRSWRLTRSRTVSRSTLRGRNSPNVCSRIVARRSLGILKAFETESASMRTSPCLDVFSRMRIEPFEDGDAQRQGRGHEGLSLIHISEPTRLLSISYAVF